MMMPDVMTILAGSKNWLSVQRLCEAVWRSWLAGRCARLAAPLKAQPRVHGARGGIPALCIPQQGGPYPAQRL